MLRAAVLAVLLSASASAQKAHPVPTMSERVVLVAVPAVVGVSTVLLAGPLAVVPVAGATYLTSSALGLGPTVGGVVLDVGGGVLVATAATAAAYVLLVDVGGAEGGLGAAIFSFVIGAGVGAASVGAIHGARLAWLRAPVEVSPASLRAPTGETAAGLTLRIGL